jgi:hypothetical protein
MLIRSATMTVSIRAWFADVFSSGMAGLAVFLFVCLLWMYLRQKWQQHKDEQERRRQRLAHWGHLYRLEDSGLRSGSTKD